MDGRIAERDVQRAAYVAFREDYRMRVNVMNADPALAWNLSELADVRARWVAIARAVLEDTRQVAII